MTRGQRNNNPLNIRRVVGTCWKGSIAPQTDPDFVQFITAEWGIRAAFCIIETYRKKYQAVCVEDIISRWAPPSENNTREYIRAVCSLTGYGEREALREKQWSRLVAAMAVIESRWQLSAEQVENGYALYKKLKNEKK